MPYQARHELSLWYKAKGFTLIELLIVIAIIALLAAILFPVFARARENARRSSCQSNMRQISLGLYQYTQDYDERMPYYVMSESPPYWHTMTEPYVKSQQIFRCPSVRKPSAAIASNFDGATYPTYGLIGRMANQNNLDYILSTVGLPLSRINQPSRTFVMVESQDSAASMASSGAGWFLVILGTIALGDSLPDAGVGPEANNVNTNVHFDGYNVAFADGHVKYLKYGSEAGYIVALRNQPA